VNIIERIAQYDDTHTFLCSLTIPQEDWPQYTSMKWAGGFRWFRSPNVVCLEKARLVMGIRFQSVTIGPEDVAS
jgi:hypothetical protein